MKLQQLLEELRIRNEFRVAMAYAIAGLSWMLNSAKSINPQNPRFTGLFLLPTFESRITRMVGLTQMAFGPSFPRRQESRSVVLTKNLTPDPLHPPGDDGTTRRLPC
jgi:hypothetical protein